MRKPGKTLRGSGNVGLPMAWVVVAGMVAGQLSLTASIASAQTLATVRVGPSDGSTLPAGTTWSAWCHYAPPTPAGDPGTGDDPWYPSSLLYSDGWMRKCVTNQPTMTNVTFEAERESFKATVTVNSSYFTTVTGYHPPGPHDPPVQGWPLYARYGSARVIVSNVDGSPAVGVSVAASVDYAPGNPRYFYWAVVQKRCVTNDEGVCDFTNQDALSQQNNWGLEVDYDDLGATQVTTQGRRSYWFEIGVPENMPQPHFWLVPGITVEGTDVLSSQLTIVRMRLGGIPQDEDDPRDPNNGGGGGGDENPGGGDSGGGSGPPCPPRGAGNPVNLLTGNVYFDQVDAVLHGIARSLSFRRTYNSQIAAEALPGAFGRGWTFSLEKRLKPVPHAPTLTRLTISDGSPIYYSNANGGSTYTAIIPSEETSWLTKAGDRFTRHFAEGGTESYDEAGLLVGQTDRFGRQTTLARDADGRVTTITLPGGRAFTLTYTGNLVSGLSGPAGPLATYAYDGDLLTGVTYPDGSGYTFTYDGAGQVLTVLDRAGMIVESHTYDGQNRGLTSSVGDGRQQLSFQYFDWRTLVTDALGQTTTYNYSTVGTAEKRITQIVGPCTSCGGQGETQTWSYDGHGRVASHTNGAGETTQYTRDAAGHVASITDPLGEVTSFTRDEFGRPLVTTDPTGGVTTATYGLAGPLTVTDPTGRTTSMGYDAFGQLASLTGPDGKTTTFAYSELGDPVSGTDALGHATSFAYDSMGRPATVTDPLGHATQIAYDARAHLSRVTAADGTHSDFTYDLAGRLTSRSDPMGRVTRWVYDTDGSLKVAQDALGGATLYERDLMSRLTSLTDARGGKTRFEYDAYGRLARQVSPGGSDSSYLYDAAGRLSSWTDHRGTIATLRHDGAGRLLERAYSDGTAEQFSYDVSGRLITATNAADTLSWTYDLAGRVLSEHSARNGTTVTHSYDSAGRLLELGADGSAQARYGYDDVGRLVSLIHGASSFQFGYDDAGRRTSLNYPNGVVTTYSYDTLNQLTALRAAAGAAGTAIVDLAYVLDADGNRTSKSGAEQVENYSYDALSRLVGVDVTGGAAGRSVFSYDAVGNRLTNQVGTNLLSAAYDVRNQVASVTAGGTLSVKGALSGPATVTVNGQAARLLAGNLFEANISVVAGPNTVTVAATDAAGHTRTSTYDVAVMGAAGSNSYDPNGNLVRKSEAGNTWLYEWDAHNLLTRVSKNDAEVARFAYDALGRRVEKAASGTTYGYVYNGVDILREARSDGVVYTYLHGPGIDEPLARIDNSGTRTYIHADGLGSITAMTDAAGAVTSRRQYDAWGNLEQGDDQPGYAFTGREWDPETQLYYYRARYYDPKIGRFISEDPIDVGRAVNRYAYVGGDPTNRIDPSGKVIVAVAIGVAVVGVVVAYYTWPAFHDWAKEWINAVKTPASTAAVESLGHAAEAVGATGAGAATEIGGTLIEATPAYLEGWNTIVELRRQEYCHLDPDSGWCDSKAVPPPFPPPDPLNVPKAPDIGHCK